MKYGVWFVRLLFAAWMIPAGLNHFVPIFPQPMGSTPLSTELVTALIDSHLFDLVKAVELTAGICILFGFYVPLVLVIAMPVSFCVFYYDAPLEGWGSRAALFGYAVFGSNLLLCLAYNKCYHQMLTLKANASKKQLALVGRILFGAGMVINGANYLVLSLWAVPTGNEPLAAQLMASLLNSGLLNVVMVLQIVAGVLILAGVLVPAALCVLMPLSTCALFWSFLDLTPLNIILALAAFALNGLLMLAYLPYYKNILQRRALAIGESGEENSNFDSLFNSPAGSIPRSVFIPVIITVLLVTFFYAFIVTGRTAQFCMLVLLYPAFMVLVRRFHAMRYITWLLFIPLLLMLVIYIVQLGYFSLGDGVDSVMSWLAPAVAVVTILWCSIRDGRNPA